MRDIPKNMVSHIIHVYQVYCEGNAIFNLKQLMRVLEIGVKSIRPLVDEVSACSKMRRSELHFLCILILSCFYFALISYDGERRVLFIACKFFIKISRKVSRVRVFIFVHLCGKLSPNYSKDWDIDTLLEYFFA